MDLEEKIEDKTTNEILFYVKKLEAEHESVKLRMIKDFDKLVEIEKKFDQATKIILNRLKK